MCMPACDLTHSQSSSAVFFKAARQGLLMKPPAHQPVWLFSQPQGFPVPAFPARAPIPSGIYVDSRDLTSGPNTCPDTDSALTSEPSASCSPHATCSPPLAVFSPEGASLNSQDHLTVGSGRVLGMEHQWEWTQVDEVTLRCVLGV